MKRDIGPPVASLVAMSKRRDSCSSLATDAAGTSVCLNMKRDIGLRAASLVAGSETRLSPVANADRASHDFEIVVNAGVWGLYH
jgi:hypothetical protein